MQSYGCSSRVQRGNSKLSPSPKNVLFGLLFLPFLICGLTPQALAAPVAPPTALESAQASPSGRGGRLVDSSDLPSTWYKASYALVIGASHYRAGWASLPGVKEDVRAVEAALKKHGFEVTVVMDPTADELERAYKQFVNRYGQKLENRLVLYFAGHGHSETLEDQRQIGYIVPVDAPIPGSSPEAFRAKAMPMEQLSVYSNQIVSRHALFLFDSCFSGSILRSRGAEQVQPRPPAVLLEQSVRLFITSGAANQTVPDESVFRRAFVDALEGSVRVSQDDYLTGTALASYLRQTVTSYNPRQTPQSATPQNYVLSQGDILFFLPKPAEPPPPPVTASTSGMEAERALDAASNVSTPTRPDKRVGIAVTSTLGAATLGMGTWATISVVSIVQQNNNGGYASAEAADQANDQAALALVGTGLFAASTVVSAFLTFDLPLPFKHMGKPASQANVSIVPSVPSGPDGRRIPISGYRPWRVDTHRQGLMLSLHVKFH